MEQQIKDISASGEVAPTGCHLARYQARGQYKAYWYYKLPAKEPIFPSKKESGKLSRYQHLGAAGTESHVQGVVMVITRNQIDELQKSIDALRDSWSDLYSDLEEKKKISSQLQLANKLFFLSRLRGCTKSQKSYANRLTIILTIAV